MRKLVKAFSVSAVAIFLLVSIILFSNTKVGSSNVEHPLDLHTPVITNTPEPTIDAKLTSKPHPKPTPASKDYWEFTVYYTPVEMYHYKERQEITGCLDWNCENGPIGLGSYPSDFLEKVRLEGVGRLTSGGYASKYLHWTSGKGYWLTQRPLDAMGNELVPLKTAASSVLAFGKKFRITDCGVNAYGGHKLSPQVCGILSSQVWEIRDRFGVTAKNNHIDLYLGEEDRENYLAANPLVVAVTNAQIELID